MNWGEDKLQILKTMKNTSLARDADRLKVDTEMVISELIMEIEELEDNLLDKEREIEGLENKIVELDDEIVTLKEQNEEN